VLFLGGARLGGVATVCDAPEGVFDRKRIECIGIVVARPFFEMGMARMRRVGDRFEQFVEAWDAAAILGRSIPFATDVARIGDARLAGADIGHGEPMLPAITKVVSVIDDGLLRLERVDDGVGARRRSGAARLRPPHPLKHILDRALGARQRLHITGTQHHIRVGPALRIEERIAADRDLGIGLGDLAELHEVVRFGQWQEAAARGSATSRQILRVEQTCHGRRGTAESDPGCSLIPGLGSSSPSISLPGPGFSPQ
jgi:hypothetical protein